MEWAKIVQKFENFPFISLSPLPFFYPSPYLLALRRRFALLMGNYVWYQTAEFAAISFAFIVIALLIRFTNIAGNVDPPAPGPVRAGRPLKLVDDFGQKPRGSAQRRKEPPPAPGRGV